MYPSHMCFIILERKLDQCYYDVNFYIRSILKNESTAAIMVFVCLIVQHTASCKLNVD